jgi:hypothetical protein
VRSIEAAELPAVCRYCRPRGRQAQARAVITFQIFDGQLLLSERKAPVCVDHGVHVQQKYVLGPCQPAER